MLGFKEVYMRYKNMCIQIQNMDITSRFHAMEIKLTRPVVGYIKYSQGENNENRTG